ncbi:FimV/HubP family polar landmark protein [Actimicrobium sp. CCI2.3]|uniref:FimV/HubP family polar landmark protein n=1 Tax=Actimicrobium sp. CCI2.3 TaxID=3048616 RepID=UPI002AB3534E|nr:FimV/HubP family polar landmark protein [Actimicrobium sp. CCI2.3]MDY7574252.1 FimV/HubP family polar landmark protein [Actimicrobium sp. CCI2.3]MEB0022748.1 FimV/HubP family polar landmark protein [Actimicrobium sp. CCI2.3]
MLATLLVSNGYAAGLGRLTVLSALGQPLSAEIELTSVSKEEAGTLAVKLASAAAFRQANIALNPAVLAIKFVVEQSGGRQFIRVSSAQPINEPFVDLLLELQGANGVLVREYTFLLDPANLRSAQVNAANSTQGRVPSSASGTSSADPVTTAVAATENPQPVSGRVKSTDAPAAIEKSYQIKRGDSLTQIAIQTRPAGVSLDQMLVALYRANPSAFVGENMNRMRTGEILTIPTADASRSVGAQEARGIIVAQAQDFGSYRNKLAGQVTTSTPQEESEAKQSAGGKITSKVEEANNAAAESRDKLKLSKSGAAGLASPKNASTASVEDSIAKDKALAEANSRVRDLERNVADLQKLLEMKNKNLAEQQKRADLAAKPVAPVADSAAVAPTPVPSVGVPSAPVIEAVKTDPPAAVTPPIDVAPEVTPPVVSPPVVSPPVVSPPVVTPPVVTPPVASIVQKPEAPAPVPVAAEVSLIDRLIANTYLLPGLGLLLVLLGGFGILSSRRKKKNQQFENSLLTDSSLKTNSMFGASGGESVDTNNSVFNSNFAPTSSQLDTNEVDPVAEADVYIAYGRDAQAEEILREALRTQPERDAVRLKLLEIYANRKDVAAFELMAGELYGRTKGDGDEWSQAASMGVALDPNNPMYAGGKAAAMKPTVVAADLGAPTRPMEDLDLDALLAATHTDMTSDPSREEAQDIVAKPIDEHVTPAPTTEAAVPVDDGLDFDLDGFDASPAPVAETPVDLAKPAQDKYSNSPVSKNDDLSMDFDVPELVTNEAEVKVSDPTDAANALDFPDTNNDALLAQEPSLPDPESPATAFEESISFQEERRSELTGNADPLDFDLSGISLDLDPEKTSADGTGAGLPEVVPAIASASELEDNLLNEPEMATKLDLAIAYEEIGDKEGARELLDEVIQGGSNEQVRQAAAMLSKFG